MAVDEIPDEELMTTKEVAQLKNVCLRVVQAAASQGELRPALKASGRRAFHFRRSDVIAWTPPCERKRRTYSDEELLLLLRRAAQELGHEPSGPDLARLGSYPAPSTYTRRFGSWGQALMLAFDTRHRVDGDGSSDVEVPA